MALEVFTVVIVGVVVVMVAAVAFVVFAVVMFVNIVTFCQSKIYLKTLICTRFAAEMIDIHSAACHTKYDDEYQCECTSKCLFYHVAKVAIFFEINDTLYYNVF